MGWNPETGEHDPEYEDTGAGDLSILHRWELLHMISEPIGLGASGRVLSVLFRVLRPGRTLFMSWSAVAREAGVGRATVARTYADLRAMGVLVTARNGKPAIDYAKALDAAIRSVQTRPVAERERRLNRLHQIAEALGRSVNMDTFAERTAHYDANPAAKPPGRLKRTHTRDRSQCDTTRSHLDTTRSHPETGRSHLDTGPVSTCDPELNTNGTLNLTPNGEINGSSRDDACRRRDEQHTPTSLRSGFQETYAGRPTLKARVRELLLTQDIVTGPDVIAACNVGRGEAGRALKGLVETGDAVCIARGKYVIAEGVHP
jgi:hypothetical protein